MLRTLFAVMSLMLMQLTALADDQAVFWQALKEGGRVVLVRHAEIDRSFGDSFLLDESCFSEKNLNELGQKQAKNIGAEFASREIKIYKVFASPHCRTKDTAELAFGSFTVNSVLRLTKALTAEKANANIEKTKALISSHKEMSNLILVTHRPNIGELANIRVEPAEMVLIQPLGDGLFDVITRLKLTESN